MRTKKLARYFALGLVTLMMSLSSVAFAQNDRPITAATGYWTLTLAEDTFASCVGTDTIRVTSADLFEQSVFTVLLERHRDSLQVNRIPLAALSDNEYLGTPSTDGEDNVQLLIHIESARAVSGSLIITYYDTQRWCSTTMPFTGSSN